MRSRRNVKRNLECLVYVPAIFVLITVIISVSRVRSFISRRTFSKEKGKRDTWREREKEKGPPECVSELPQSQSMLTSKRKAYT